MTVTALDRPDRHPVTLTALEVCLILGATAETIEEGRQPYTASDLKALVELHSRFLQLLGPEGAQSDYALSPGGHVVSATDPWCVIAVPVIDDDEVAHG